MAAHSSTLAWRIPWVEEPVGCSPWGQGELDTTERLHFHFSLPCTGEGNGNPLQCSCLENPRDREPGGLRSMGSHRVGHNWSDLAAAAKYFEKYSSTGYITAAFMFASRHPGLEIKYCTTILYTVLYIKVHKSTTTCRGCTYMTTYARHVN